MKRYTFPGWLSLQLPDAWTPSPPDHPDTVLLLEIPGGRGIFEVLRVHSHTDDLAQALTSLVAIPPDVPPRLVDLPHGTRAAFAVIRHTSPPAVQHVALLAHDDRLALLSLTGDPAATGPFLETITEAARSLVWVRPFSQRWRDLAGDALSQLHPDLALQPTGPDRFTLQRDGWTGTWSLLPLLRALSLGHPDQDAAQIQAFAEQLHLDPTPPDPDHLYPSLAPANLALAAKASSEAAPASLLKVIEDDRRLTSRWLTPAEVDALGGWDAVWERACANLDDLLHETPMDGSADDHGRPVMISTGGHSYAASAVLTPHFGPNLTGSLGSPLRLCLPTRSTLIAYRVGDAPLESHVWASAARTYDDSSDPLTEAVFQLDGPTLSSPSSWRTPNA